MDFRILGPLEVVHNERELGLQGRKARALLAILLLRRGTVISRAHLIDELWGEHPPPSAWKSLPVHIWRLRRGLDELGLRGDAVLTTRNRGYALQFEAEQFDLMRFERLAAEGRQALANGDPDGAAAALAQALSLWRGAPLGDLADEPFARAEVARLEELRLDVTEDRIESDLDCGRHRDVIGEFDALIAQNPYREHLRELHMLALYRAGRQADALDAYRAARRSLVDELGIEPGERLRDLERAILAQDPALSGRSAVDAPKPARSTPARRRSAVLSVGVLVLAAAAIAIPSLVATRGSSSAEVLGDNARAVALIDPATNDVASTIPVETSPGVLAFEPRSRSLWVASHDQKAVTRIDGDRARVSRIVTLTEQPTGLVADGGAVWAAGRRTSKQLVVRRIDSRFDVPGRAIRIDGLADDQPALALHGNYLWLISSKGRLIRIDARDGSVVQRSADVDHSPVALAARGGAIWEADRSAGVVSRVDSRTGTSTAVPVAGGPNDLALGASALWVAQSLQDSVVRIDPATASVRSTARVGRRPVGVALGAGGVWVANSGDGTVSRIDPLSGRVVATIPVGGSPQDVVVAAGRVWVSVAPRAQRSASAERTLRVETSLGSTVLDPAVADGAFEWQLEYATCAKLLNYPPGTDPAAIRLRPELAAAMPSVSDGGRTYTFRIKGDARFSPPSSEPVTAQAVKYSIERSLHPKQGSRARSLVSDIVGARSFTSGRAPHLQGVRARGEILTVRIARPSSTFLSRISMPFFCVVPRGTPIDAGGIARIPSAGPYYAAASEPSEGLVLRRNPNYAGPRSQHLEEIRVSFGLGKERTISDVEAGRVDYAAGMIAVPGARGLLRRYGPGSPAARAGRQRFFAVPSHGFNYVVFNTARRPFSSVRLRQAVNYALDRRALARADGVPGGLGALPTDQYLPPAGVLGFRDARIYPFSPDLARARRLAGRARRNVVLYAYTLDKAPTVEPRNLELLQTIKANLRAIGLDVQIRVFTLASFLERVSRPREPFDMILTGTSPDYPDPMALLSRLDSRTSLTAADANFGTFRDPSFDDRLAAAATLPSGLRELALGRLADDMARTRAPWASLVVWLEHGFFSARTGCQRFHPVYGLDVTSLCVRGG